MGVGIWTGLLTTYSQELEQWLAHSRSTHLPSLVELMSGCVWRHIVK